MPHVFNDEMMDMYLNAAELTDQYNQIPIKNDEARTKFLHKLLGSVGKDVMVMPIFRCEFGFNISVGDRVFVNYNCIFHDNYRITIGNDVRIAPNVGIYTINHAFDPVERAGGVCVYKPVTIKDNV